MSADTYGLLTSRTLRRKRVDVWEFSSPFDRFRKKRYVATILLVNPGGDGVTFRAESEHLTPALHDTDIRRLREKVEREFQRQDMEERAVAWEDWIEIAMGEEFMYKGENAAKLEVTWRYLKRGVHQASGVVYTILEHNHVVVPFPSPKRAGESDPDASGTWGRGRDLHVQYSYVKATPEIVAGLESLATAIREAREKLRGLVDQQNVARSLADRATLRLEAKEVS